ncbi:MAG: hypothetical protein AAGB02_05620 [Pseudomonadota bacterium]
MRQNTLYFANFVLRFGEEKALLDYAEQILIPAFTDDTLIKSYTSASFYFYEARLERLNDDKDNPVMALTGRFIKDTELRREQIFDPKKGLIKDEKSIRSCPNAYFILVLNDHRLLYLPETRNAPGFGAFKNTALSFIREKHNQFIEQLQSEAKQSNEKLTKKALRTEHPSPSLEVLPIVAKDAIEDFVDRYAVLKQIDFRLISPNEEIDTKSLLADVRQHLGQELNASSTKVTTRNSKGLDLTSAREKLVEASDSDNREIILSGTDKSGNLLKGDNDSFKVETPIETVPSERKRLNRVLFDAFRDNVKAKSIKAAEVADKAKSAIKKLSALL